MSNQYDPYANLNRYSPGDKVKIKTVLDHQANIKHVNYVFRNREDKETQVVIGYDVKEDQQGHGNRIHVELEWVVPREQSTGPYLVEPITATTFEGDLVDANFDFGGYAGFFVEPESEEKPYASGWEVS